MRCHRRRCADEVGALAPALCDLVTAPFALAVSELLAVVVLVGQATKWALATLFRDGIVVEVTPFFNLVAVWNRGVSFGFGGDNPMAPYYLSGFAVAVVVGLLVWLARAPSPVIADFAWSGYWRSN